MHLHFSRLRWLCLILLLLSKDSTTAASEWRTIDLTARPINITENNGTLWVCGADELIAASVDGGKSWTAKHNVRNGAVLLTVGFANERFGYAAGTGGSVLLTKDGGDTWIAIQAPAQVVYEVSFSDEKHGLIHTARTIYTTADGGDTWSPVKIDLGNGDLKEFPFVLESVALDAAHMAIILSRGGSHVYEYRLLLTKNGGETWKVVDIPSTGLAKLTAHDGEYWFAGHEVIEKDKPGGGYGVPLIMHSADGESWTHLPRWGKNEFSECNTQGCLYWDGAGVQIPPTSPTSFWMFTTEKMVTARWAVAKGSICSVGVSFKCATVTTTQTIPPYADNSSPIEPPIAAPALDAKTSSGLQCIYCDFERIMVTQDFHGPAEVQLKLHIGPNGLVDQVEILHATNSGIGTRVASSARNWIFVPYMKDGTVHPAITEVKLNVQAIKSK